MVPQHPACSLAIQCVRPLFCATLTTVQAQEAYSCPQFRTCRPNGKQTECSSSLASPSILAASPLRRQSSRPSAKQLDVVQFTCSPGFSSPRQCSPSGSLRYPAKKYICNIIRIPPCFCVFA